MTYLPPFDSDLGLPEVVNFHLKHNPQAINYVHASATNQLLTISRLEFGRACHRIAHSLLSDTSNSPGAVMAIVALADPILYHAAIVGCMMVGLVVS